MFSNTLSVLSSLNVSDQASHPYKTTGKIIVLCILIFNFLDSNLEDKRQKYGHTRIKFKCHRQTQQTVLVSSIDAVSFGRVDYPQALKFMTLKTHDRNMLDLLTQLIKFVAVDGDIYVNVDTLYHNGMNSTKNAKILFHSSLFPHCPYTNIIGV
jgi:hypothetical protein